MLHRYARKMNKRHSALVNKALKISKIGDVSHKTKKVVEIIFFREPEVFPDFLKINVLKVFGVLYNENSGKTTKTTKRVKPGKPAFTCPK